MKLQYTEHEGCFAFDLTPENAEEVVMLTRFALNVTEELRHHSVHFSRDGTCTAALVLGKRKQVKSAI